MMRFSDIHSHFVYGMDDGAQTREEMEAMLDAAAADGIAKLIATPHMTPGIYPFDEERFRKHLDEAQEYCARCGYGMELYSGAEILYTPALEHYADGRRLITLAHSEYVLLEFAPALPYQEIKSAVEMLGRSGYTPIIAHVERYRELGGARIYQLKEQTAVKYQMNCRTVLDSGGMIRNARIRKWLRDELIDYVATDSHDCTHRRTCMKRTYELLVRQYGEHYAERLVSMI